MVVLASLSVLCYAVAVTGNGATPSTAAVYAVAAVRRIRHPNGAAPVSQERRI